MALHFQLEEYVARKRKLSDALKARTLDGILIFRQESMYYLSGYDTSGYSMFQGMYYGVDGSMALLTRSADLRQAQITSTILDVRIWVDKDGANPADDLKAMLADYGCEGKRIGIEYHAYGLTALRGKWVDAALDGFCLTEDASDVVNRLRLVKSPAELVYVRRAGALVDEALEVSKALTKPGAELGAVYGAMSNTVMRGDGDPPASRWPMGSGVEALLARYHTGHGVVGKDDQVIFEPAAAYRHYHAALMYVILTGRASARQRAMFDACAEALAICKEKLKPGNRVGDVYQAHADCFTKAGYQGLFLNACGYSLGATYPPTWMDPPMVYSGERSVFEPNMVFFIHMVLLDSENKLSMTLGETVIITPNGNEPVSHAPKALLSLE